MSEQAPDIDRIVLELVAERKRQGLSQRAVGRILGASSATLCLWERGDHSPTLDHLHAWAEALGRRLVLIAPPDAIATLLAEVERLREALHQSEGEREDLDTATGILLGENVEFEAEVERLKAERDEMSGWIEEHALIKTLARAEAAEALALKGSERIEELEAELDVLGLALNGGLADHVDGDCAVCNHGVVAQVVDIADENERRAEAAEALAAERGERIAATCQEWAVERFAVYGPHDVRGAALWDVAAWIRETGDDRG